MERVCELFRVSERRVCRIVRQARSTQRYQPRCRDDEGRLTARVVELASLYGRYGYRQVWGLLRMEGWRVNRKRVERIWRQEGLKVPRKQPKRGRLWLNDGSCVRRRPEHPNHVWAYDFCADRTHDGRPVHGELLIRHLSKMTGVAYNLTRRIERRAFPSPALLLLPEGFI